MNQTLNSVPAPCSSNCIAIVFDQQEECWLQFNNPGKTLTATTAGEVLPVMEAVEQAAAEGMTAIGYVAYEAASAFDPGLPTHQACGPLAQFSLFESSQRIELDDPEEFPNLQLELSMDEESYLQQLHEINALLEAGEIYQVNFTHQLQGVNPELSTLAVFKQLLQRQPSPRSVYYRSPDLTLMSVSPELFFSLDGEKIVMEPMKGTRPRGKTPDEDTKLRNALLNSEKEQAENLMIVDMVRNDLSKIAMQGSVKVQQLFRLVQLPTLWQKVSAVEARTEASLVDIFRALFPCASITGAPKRQSMEVIHRLEPKARGVYTGAVGIVKPNRQAQFSVAIRTLIASNQERDYSYGIGSGVVWDSVTGEEWQETLDKAKIVQSLSQPDFQLLETMAFIPGDGVFLLDYHLERLQRAADEFQFDLKLGPIKQAIAELAPEVPTRLRLLVQQDGCFELQQQEIRANEGNVVLAVAGHAINSDNRFLQHKTTRRGVYEAALAAAGNCDDVILWNERGELTETCIYNIFLQIGEELLTPQQQSGLLPGTYRRMMLETGQAREALLKLEDLERASALFVANSVQGLREARLVRWSKHSRAGSFR